MSEKSAQSSPQSQPATASTQSSPQIVTQQTPTNVNQPVTISANQSPQPQLTQKPPQPTLATARPPPTAQQSPKTIAPQQSQPPTNTNAAGAASSMTLLDNLTSQLSPERKERFIELFRQLQSNNVTANQFLAQARMLLDQRQYQQLENLKSKPAQQPKTATPGRSPIQPQQYNVNQPMNSSQIRAEDAQRSMSGLLAPHPKRSKTTDNTSQPSPLYRSNTAPVNQQQMQQQLKQQQQMPPQQQAKPQQFQSQQDFIPQQPNNTHVQVIGQTTENTSTPIKNDHTDPQGLGQNVLNPELLVKRLKTLIEPMNLKVGQGVETLIALSVEKRVYGLLQEMISASKYRVDSQSFTQPPVDETGHHPFKIVDIQDIKKQLLAVERVEREEERKRKEIMLERERKAQLGEEGGEGGDEDRPSKKKKKKEMGPGVTARYMSDDVRNKTTNETALLIAGGVKKSWMYAATPSKDKAPSLSISKQNSSSVHDAISPTSTLPSSAGPLSTSPTNTTYSAFDSQNDDQPRGRGRPRRRKSGGGQDASVGAKKAKGFGRGTTEAGLFLPPSTIGRPHRLGEQTTRKVTIRDALFVLEDENENNTESARRTLLKAYSIYLK